MPFNSHHNTGKSSFDAHLPAVFELKSGGNNVQGNVAAGSERLGFALAGDACKGPGRFLNNSAHGCLASMILYANEEGAACTALRNFTSYLSWWVGAEDMQQHHAHCTGAASTNQGIGSKFGRLKAAMAPYGIVDLSSVQAPCMGRKKRVLVHATALMYAAQYARTLMWPSHAACAQGLWRADNGWHHNTSRHVRYHHCW